MIAASFAVKLTLQGPILTHSTTPGRYGVDAVMAKCGEHYCIPGTLVKGLISEAWQELGCVEPSFADLRERWFGEISQIRDLPQRGTIYFGDLIDPATRTDGTRTQFRIEIDEERGSVRHGHYLVLEAPYRSGQPVAFEGKVSVLASSRQRAEDARKDVQTALRWMGSAGAERSIGFGRVLDAECGPLKCEEWQADARTSSEVAFDLEIRFDRPVCFARRRVAGNLFESEDWITGAALKGSLATLLEFDRNRWVNLRANLAFIRFTHAFPAPTGKPRPVFPPESLVKIDGKPLDAILLDEPRAEGRFAPEFRVDWKEPFDAFKVFGWPELKRELRVRTAIDGEARRAAEQQLFAYETIVPGGNVWRGSVVLDGVAKEVRPAVAAELEQALANGLFAMGKTKARAAVTARPSTLKSAALEKDEIAITLQTAALLCDPGRHLAPREQIGSADRDKMQNEYEQVWDDLSGGALRLKHYFHRMSLAGSGYLRHRFQNGKRYRPYLLTDPGSVFVLRIHEREKAEQCITNWLNRGIELSKAVRKFYFLEGIEERELWQHCPFLPENGFGEIAVDVHEKGSVGVWHV